MGDCVTPLILLNPTQAMLVVGSLIAAVGLITDSSVTVVASMLVGASCMQPLTGESITQQLT